MNIPGYVFIRNDRSWANEPNSVFPKERGSFGLYLNEQLDFDVNMYKVYNRSFADIEMGTHKK